MALSVPVILAPVVVTVTMLAKPPTLMTMFALATGIETLLVPFATPAVLIAKVDALVTRPLLSTVKLGIAVAFPYVPGVTAVLASVNAMFPVDATLLPVASPVISVFVKSTIDATPGSILVKSRPSAVLIASSPSTRLPVLGTEFAAALLFNIIILAILVFLSSCHSQSPDRY